MRAAGRALRGRALLPVEFDHRAFDRLVKRLVELPAGDERRIEAVDMATRYAKPAGLGPAAGGHDSNHTRLHVAWRLLWALDVIRVGARREDLVAVLGKPTSRYEGRGGMETWQWEYHSTMHVNPVLRIKLKDNAVTGIEIDRK